MIVLEQPDDTPSCTLFLLRKLKISFVKRGVDNASCHYKVKRTSCSCPITHPFKVFLLPLPLSATFRLNLTCFRSHLLLSEVTMETRSSYDTRTRDWSGSYDSAYMKNSNDYDQNPTRYDLKRESTVPDTQHHEHVPLPDGAPTGSSQTTASSGLQRTRAAIGLHPTAPVVSDHDFADESDLWWPRVRLALREPLAEFFGVVIMILFGDGSVAQVLLSAGEKSAPGANGYGAYQSISWGWGLGVMLGIYVAGDSGAYLNPAVTFTNCLLRKLPWRRFPVYFIAQLLGGFVGAGVVYANYINAINQVEGHGKRTVPPNPTATAGVFCTYPQSFLTKASQFFSEFIASWILMFVIFALKDDSNKGFSKGSGNWFPLSMFFLIFGLGACFGWETG